MLVDFVVEGGDGAAVFLIFFFAAAAEPAIIFVFAILTSPFVFLMSSVAAAVEFLISLQYKVYCGVSIDNRMLTIIYKPSDKLFFQ